MNILHEIKLIAPYIAPSTTGQQNEIQRNLDAIGAYTHLNNLQLLPTGVEEVRYDRASKVDLT